MSTRHPDKEMLKSFGSFDITVKLCKHAHTASKVSRYKGLLDSLETNYYKFDENWRVYKDDTIAKIAKTVEAFNEVKTDEEGVETVAFAHNDKWADVQMKRYIEISDLLHDGLDGAGGGDVEDTNVENNVDVNLVVGEIKAKFNSLQSSIVKLKAEIEGYDDQEMPAGIATGYENILLKLGKDIEVDLKEKVVTKMALSEVATDPEYTNEKLTTQFGTFMEEQRLELHSCQMLLVRKSKGRNPETKPVVESSQASASVGRPRESVFLEKTKPPRFNGDDLEFAEFKRKWFSQVSKANLPEETELDKLRDCIPKDARDQLYGVNSLESAWSILSQRFGDKMLISKKLKNQLKSIQCEGKSDPEMLINLKIKVRNIVTRLEALGMGVALTHDAEFLSAVYCALPDRHKVRWLDFDKSGDHWNSMLTFLDRAYEQANQELALLSVYTKDVDKSVKKPVKTYGLTVAKAKDDDLEEDEDIRKFKEAKIKARDSCGNCPVCTKQHTWKRRDGSTWPSDRFIQCKKFSDMSTSQRANAVEKAKGCPRCTSWGHTRTDCKMKPNSCGADVGATKCTGDHSKLLHGSGNVYCAVLSAGLTSSSADMFDCVKEEEATVYYLQDIKVKKSKDPCRVFWDRGSNRVLIREGFAKAANLIKKEVVYHMEGINDEQGKQVHSYIYLLDIVDMYGNVHTIWGYGVPRIMTSHVPDLTPVRDFFPHIPSEAFNSLPDTEVDVLIGLNMNEVHPAGGTGVDRVGGLSALRSLFGCGWVIGGHHEDIKVPISPPLSTTAASLRIAKLLVRPEPSYTPEFWESEGMGVMPPSRCDNCRGCMRSGPCSERHFEHGVKKQAELDLIKSKVKLIDGEIWCEYPYVKDPACLPYNRSVAVKVAEKVEKDLLKDGLHGAYCDQVKQILDRGAAIKLSSEDMESWSGPCQYVTHHAALKDSVTTPVRMVSNSSFNNRGNSFNSCLVAGPNSLNPMLNVMLRFRCWPVAVQFDMSKAYNTMRTGLVERNLRRFVWRWNPSEPWQDFAFDRVHFGDLPASVQLEVAKDICADVGATIDPVAAQRIKDDIYVDDGLTGGDEELVKRFVGKKQSNGSYDGTFTQILAKGNFKIKAFAISGDKRNEESELMGNKVLGYSYDNETDMMGVTFPINISKKKRSVRQEPDLSINDVVLLKSRSLSKRILLGITNGFGDFLGLAAPFTIRFKVLMRNLFLLEDPLTWDQAVPVECQADWVELVVEALQAGSLPFPRCTRPPTAAPGLGPIIVGFADHGQFAYEARVYLRWQLEDGVSFEARLAICKAKVPPLRGLTVPRGELTALTLLSRLILSVTIALQKLDTPPVSSIMLSDSKCSISAVNTTRPLLPYFQNRVAEIKDNMDQVKKYCPMEDVFYVPSALNPSDISTRATLKVSELGPDSFHQSGPNFLSLGRDSWPVTRDFSANDVPEDEVRVRDKTVFCAAARANFCHTDVHPKNPWGVVEKLLHYSNNIKKVIRIIARYLRGVKVGFRKFNEMKIENVAAYDVIAADHNKTELDTAERLLLLHGMVHTQEALTAGRLSSLLPFRIGKLIVTRGRVGERSLEKLLGISYLPILMADSQVAFLYMVYAHCGEFGLVHRSVVSTLARSRSQVWIIRGRDLAKRVVNTCPRCNKDRMVLLVQQMADIKEEQLTVAPPWTHVALDFAGPVLAKGQVNKRAKLKVWILVYSCRATRAICLLATPGYSTADFMCKHEEFVFRKGRPSSIVSDRGSQLVAAGIVVAEKDFPSNKVDWKKVTSENSATNWTFVPVGGQHRNGISEATVKVLKKSLSLALQPGVDLTYAELVTLLSKITYSINSRPLSIKYISPSSQQEDLLTPLTPNHLLLGRATIDVPDNEYDADNKFSARLAYIQQLHKSWWDRWIQDVLPTLVPCRRWKDIKKNLKIGDIVTMKYAGNFQDDYRIARVLEVYPDNKGLIRTVKVGFRRRDKREKPEDYWKKPLQEEQVAIQRLSILQAAGEPLPTGGTEDQLPVDAEVRVALVKAAMSNV